MTKQVIIASLSLCTSIWAAEIYTKAEFNSEEFNIYNEQGELIRTEIPQVPHLPSDELDIRTFRIIDLNGDVRIYYALSIIGDSGRQNAIYYYSRTNDHTQKVIDLSSDIFNDHKAFFCLDKENEYIFWFDYGGTPPNEGIFLNRANLEGGNKITVSDNRFQTLPWSMVADPVRQKIYWQGGSIDVVPNLAVDKVYSMGYNGSSPEVLFPNSDWCNSLDISEDSESLYFFNANASPYSIQQLDLSSSTVSTVISNLSELSMGNMRKQGDVFWYLGESTLLTCNSATGVTTNFDSFLNLSGDFDFAPVLQVTYPEKAVIWTEYSNTLSNWIPCVNGIYDISDTIQGFYRSKIAFTSVFPSNGHYYAYAPYSVSWSNANEIAQNLGGYLATITSAEENQFVADLIESDGSAWIGLFQDPTGTEPTGGWRWVTGEPLSYTGWNGGEPNQYKGAEEDYGVLGSSTHHQSQWRGKWADIPIDAPSSTGFVIEFDSSDTESIAGTWSFTVYGADATQAQVALTQSGIAITGTATDDIPLDYNVTGSISGDDVSLTLTPVPSGDWLICSGVMQGNSMSGVFAAEDGNTGTWEASKTN